MEAPFDFTVKDMPVLRKWWCTVLLENCHLDGHGRRFARFTEEAKQMAGSTGGARTATSSRYLRLTRLASNSFLSRLVIASRHTGSGVTRVRGSIH
ncbi:unnamed protein product [Arctogadus glacialis]